MIFTLHSITNTLGTVKNCAKFVQYLSNIVRLYFMTRGHLSFLKRAVLCIKIIVQRHVAQLLFPIGF